MGKHGNAGFTLIEMMVTVALFAILVTSGLPNMRSFMQNNQSINEYNRFVGTLNLARSEAAKRSLPVTICASDDGASCNTQEWEVGWLVFTDADGDGAVDNGVDQIVGVGDPLQAATLRAAGFANAGRVNYNPRGSLGVAGTDSGVFTLCDGRGVSHARAVVIGVTGQVRRGRDGNGDGVVEDLSGSDISCPVS